MLKVWFDHDAPFKFVRGANHMVADVIKPEAFRDPFIQNMIKESAFKVINDFLDNHNYKSYYQRTWKKDDKTTVVDVGSHTEFFYIQEV